MAELSANERALHAELGELRAEVAERGRVIVVFTEENTGLREQNATLAEKLVALVDRVAELERRLGQNPRNSHKPPSSEGYDKPAPRSRRERTDRASGGQPGHEGRTLCQVEAPDERVVHTPRGCGGCGRSLIGAPVVSTETRQVFDLPEIVLRVVEHRFEHRRCGCGATTMADVPTGVGAPTQYGPRVRAFAVYLLAAQHICRWRAPPNCSAKFSTHRCRKARWRAGTPPPRPGWTGSTPRCATHSPPPRCSARTRPASGSAEHWPGCTRRAPTP
jgi:hypothetical protein